MQIGRKIYFEKATGNVILDTGERQGAVVETTTEQDFAMYRALQNYVPEQVGVAQLEYGQDAQKFGVYEYRIDPATGKLAWGTLIDPNTPAQQPTIEQRLAEVMENQLITMDAIATLYETVLGGGTTSG